MSEDDKKRERLREMEVTQEQWEQFEQITKQNSSKNKPDPTEQVEARIRAFVEANGAAALRSLVVNGGSERVRASVAQAFCNVAVVQSVRGKLFSQGAAKALIDLALKPSEVPMKKMDKPSRDAHRKMKILAGHALAKMFITTDPNLIPNSTVMDSIKPLINNLKLNDEDLISFETSMALTNLATVNQEVKRKIINLEGLRFLEYTTYNDDLLVRRAACECISNLVPEPEVIDWLCAGNHMKLWLMFAGAYEDDLKTSEACLGALAGVCSDSRIAEAIEKVEMTPPEEKTQEGADAIKETGLLTLIVILYSEELSLVHRAGVCIFYLLQSLEDGVKKFKRLKLEDSVKKAIDSPTLNLERNTNVKEILDLIIEMLNEEPGMPAQS